jgi:hypothetical protein
VNKSIEMLCAHSIIVCAAFLSLGMFVVAGWLPPVSPSLDAESVVAMFATHRLRIQIGMTLLGFSSMFYWSFAAAIATQMNRIEGEHHPLTRLQLLASNGTALAIMALAFLGLAMTFRPHIEPGTMQLANDLLWLVFVGLYPPGVMQNLAIGLCILNDKREGDSRVYPRWVGFVNLWVAASFGPGLYIVFFKSGPFAWNGLLGFWPVAVGFFVWASVMWWVTVRAIRRAP